LLDAEGTPWPGVEEGSMDGLDILSRESLLALIQRFEERVAALEAENDLLRSQLQGKGPGNAPPPFVKANRKPREPGERKQRPHSYTRPREIATREVEHAVETCPDCGRQLEGGWEHSRHQVIEIPQVPVEIIDHVLIRRWCGICGEKRLPKLGPADGVVGQHRVGPRLMSLVATLSAEHRLPQRSIQTLIESVYSVHLGLGEITEILHVVADRGAAIVAGILEEIRSAPVVHGDETGWREDGINGYLWSVSTPTARYFYRDQSRAAAVIQRILADFEGVLVTDFYSAYSWYLGPAQRCWAHFCRDLKKLRDEHKEAQGVTEWVKSVLSIHRRAKDAAEEHVSAEERRRKRLQFDQEALALARPYLTEKETPQHTLAKRINQFQKQLFTFVELPGVPSENNAAERALRPAVIARKISGGTRSPKGSETKSALLTLFGTWKLRREDLLQACLQMLIAPQALPRPAPS
jgi:transposase